MYVNGGLNYSYRGYGALGSNLQPPASLQTGNHSNGEWERPRLPDLKPGLCASQPRGRGQGPAESEPPAWHSYLPHFSLGQSSGWTVRKSQLVKTADQAFRASEEAALALDWMHGWASPSFRPARS